MPKPEKKELKIPSCRLGYTVDDLKEIIGHDLTEFHEWMIGQTISICDGRAYDHEFSAYVDTGCGPHGSVVYYHDVKRFLNNLPVID